MDKFWPIIGCWVYLEYFIVGDFRPCFDDGQILINFSGFGLCV
jgi:hypothetical protein